MADAHGDRRALGTKFAARVIAEKEQLLSDRRGRCDGGVSLPEHQTDTAQGPSGADRTDERSISPQVCSQFSGPVVSTWALSIGDIVELVRPNGAVRLQLRQLAGETGRYLHIVILVG